jgi:hypothetical protein
MVKPYNQKAFLEADNSHRAAMERMAAASKEQGDQGIRAIQIYQTLATTLLEPDEVTEYALDVQSRATAAWEIAKAYEVQSLDATAAAMGVTRQALLDQMAAVPPTFG